jgi:spoIIIJ-associated protein
MIYEFEGRTEKEAIDKAAEELGLEKDDFDVEILETQKHGLFKKGYVKIRVHTDTQQKNIRSSAGSHNTLKTQLQVPSAQPPVPQSGFEEKIIEFITGLIERMGYSGKVSILFRESHKLGLKIESDYSSILIGKKGKNLDALQLLLNLYAGKLGKDNIRVILDTENYRIRREESLVRLAYNVAEKVRESRSSILLEPMNPFDRWLIHTTLNDINDIETKSEGDGLYKQIRVFYRGYK